jgi:hypothetical protein
MKRTLAPIITRDAAKKIILLSGPRQSGKTTLAKMIDPQATYLNYDDIEDRQRIHDRSWNPKSSTLILDELHKMPEWKRFLKGLYDTRGIPPQLLVTGSAKMDTYRKVGDSLAGRFFSFRVHPLDIKEAHPQFSAQVSFERLMRVGGFPEPFLSDEDTTFYGRWVKSHLDIILRQDLVDMATIQDIHTIERLIELLRHRVGSSISYANLARDLHKDPKTIKRWLTLLEDLYIIFSLTPYHQRVTRSLLKEPKYYFYNPAYTKGDIGARFENVVACALLKHCHWQQDIEGQDMDLHFLRTHTGHEVDFAITLDNSPICLIECKWTDTTLSRHLPYFQSIFPEASAVQLVGQGLRHARYYPENNREIAVASDWLRDLAPTTAPQK